MFHAIGILIGVVAVIALVLTVLVVVGAVKAARAVARKVEKTEAQARRAVENVALKAKTYAKPGPQGEVAAVRLALRTSLSGTREVLEGGLAGDEQLGEALGLLARLDGHAAELDAQLRMLEREPESVRVAAKLAELRPRAEEITRSAESLRWAAQDRMHRFAAEDLSRLSEEIASEAGALRHWETGASRAGGVPGGNAGGASGASGASGVSGASRASRASGAGGASGGGRAGVTPDRPGLAAGGKWPSAAEMLGLAEQVKTAAQRLHKPAPGSSGS
jgi:hypothetical protein